MLSDIRRTIKIIMGVISCAVLVLPAQAEVSSIEITSTQSVGNNQSFGSAGPYEELSGTIYFELDPANPLNQVITDIEFAPLNANGRVEISADITVQRPVDRSLGNNVAIVDIPNRGSRPINLFNRPTSAAPQGDDFLLHEGYTLVWIGWEFDVPNPNGFSIEVPSVEGNAIAGLGFAAVRDVTSWIKYDADSLVSAQHTLSYGLSQSGRFLRNFLYLGFNTDEEGRQVFDGMIPHIAGSSRIDLNRRGAEPVSQGQYTATSFPFADDAYSDPVSDVTEGMLDNARAQANQPNIFYTNTAVEYWGGGRVAALVHSTPDGAEDIALPSNVRFYFLTGTQHVPGGFPPAAPSTGQQMGNPLDYWWSMRALLTALTDWVVDGVEPPQSAHPSRANNNLVSPQAVQFPAIPGVHSPAEVTAGVRIANSIHGDSAGMGAALPLLVPQVDADGNETSGIRHPELSVPLATYTGWNFTNAAVGDPDNLFAPGWSLHPFCRYRG